MLDLASKSLVRLTKPPDPAPFFSSVKAELITYARSGGVQLSGTLCLPPRYDKARDGKLPFFLWAYPTAFMSQDAAPQVAGSPHQCRRPSRAEHLLLLAAGILSFGDGVILGKGETWERDAPIVLACRSVPTIG